MYARLDFLFSIAHMPGNDVTLHRHGCYELVYYLKGNGKTRIGDDDYEYREDDYALIRPGTPHDERHAAPTEVLCLGFAPLREFALPEGVFSDQRFKDDVDDYAPVLPLLLGMVKEMRNKDEDYAGMLDLLASQLVLMLRRRLAGGSPAYDEDKFRYAINYMNENFHQRIDFGSLAAMAGYSLDRYRHLFKAHTGASPGRYVLGRRIAHARTLLRETRRSISGIAADCGFASDSQFCSLFKRETGWSPGAYRKASP
ncbi:helix-turn-helix domain-containing protein [Cohnella sp. GCM10012308]|uniref:helix-turn-helix domain-containing protein n=1 Tax=Cohnella sp. GCM10012308 TaxID=3317329 RepID=UPI00360EBC83